MKAYRLIQLAAVFLFLSLASAPAAERKPLLVEGKTTIYQRVLSKPGAAMFSAPEDAAETGRIRPFQPLYVYGRQGDWIEYGRGLASGAEGWVRGADVVPWRQNIVVAFANPAGRQRQLMFDSQESLMRLLNDEAALSWAARYREEASAGIASPDSGVISIEPEEYVDIAQNFYLLPILDWSEGLHPMTFEPMRLLKVASLPLKEPVAPEIRDPAENYKVGLVFVIDTTSSMGPFIDETRKAVTEILTEIQGSPVGERVRFGVIGYRDSTRAAPGIGYTTKVFVPLRMDQTEEEVLQGLSGISEARRSTVGFDEDAVAGVIEAIDLDGWGSGAAGDPNSFGGRYVVLISDASPKQPTDPHARFNLDPQAVSLRARERRILLLAMHLLTPDGRPNHAAAERAYREMTQSAISGRSLYYPVADGSRAAFAAQVRDLSEFFVSQVTEDITAMRVRAQDPQQNLTPLEEASLAMRLAYLGSAVGSSVPPLFESWLVDRSIENPLIPSLDVRLLITKNELATMRDVMAEILEAGEVTQGQMRQGDFFEMLRGAVARIATDTGSLVNTRFETLGDAVGEFLGDLPFRSQLMEITSDEWENMGSRRRVILDRVRARLTLYEQYHDDPSIWVSLYDGAPAGEHVLAMPLEALP